ncbi:MAG: amidohydrolase family protein [Pirellulaceae bacterium]|nr:amidohydrolase family protein [Pirellulaceae bacterium]
MIYARFWDTARAFATQAIRLATMCGLATSLLVADAFAQGTAPDVGIRFQPPNAVLLTNAKLVISPDKTLDTADLLVRDGKIVEIGVDLAVPPDAEVIDCKNKYVYPGLIDAYVEFPTASAALPAVSWNASVQPHRSLSDQLKPDSGKLQTLRKAGVTVVLAAPDNGIFKGQSCIITTAEKPLEATMLKADVFQHIRLLPERQSRGSYPSSPMGAVALVRQTLLDANWYQQALQAFEANPAIPAPEVNISLAALESAVRGRQMTIIDGPNDLYALRADRMAKEFSLKAIFRGSGREYRQLDAMAAMGRTFIVPVDFPKPPEVDTVAAAMDASLQSLMHWYLAPENPGRMEKAGIDFVLTSDTLASPNELLPNVIKAVERGLSEGAALAALTTRPAKLLGVDHLAGTLQTGKLANLIVTDGPLFSTKTKVLETWVAGKRDAWNEEAKTDLRGTWKLELTGDAELKQLDLKLSGTPDKVKAELGVVGAFAEKPAKEKETAKAEVKAEVKAEEKPPEPAVKEEGKKEEPKKEEPKKETKEPELAKIEFKQFKFDGYRMTGMFRSDALRKDADGMAYFTAVVSAEENIREFTGSIQWPNGTATPLTGKLPEDAVAKKETSEPEKKDEKSAEEPLKVEVNFPLGAYGAKGISEQSEWILIRGATIWTCGDAGKIDGGDLLIHYGHISAVAKHIDAPEGAKIIDAAGMHISPGIIDCHSHMASDGGINEGSQAVTSEVRIADFIDATDITIYRQLAGGVTTANILHGSANPIGGQNQVIKLRWGASDAALIMSEAPAGVKFALGENVKRSSSPETDNPRYPLSRMGVEQIMRDRFEAAKLYRQKQQEWMTKPIGLPPRRDLELDAIAEILEGKRWIHCHSYRQDEILTFLRLLEDYKVTVGSLQHILEGYKVAEAMAKHGATGSTFSDWWAYKMEVFDAIPFNGALMHRAGIIVSFNSDDDELARHLNHEAAKAVKYGGVTPEEALKFVTLNPAKQLRIDALVGSLEAGKQADFVLWNGPPLSTLSVCLQTWIDGRKYFDRDVDLARRAEDAKLQRQLVQKILMSGEKTTKKSQAEKDPSMWWVRYDEFCNHGHHHDEHAQHEEHAGEE